MLEAPYWHYWGKASAETTADAWHPFAYHSLDVAAVAASLWHGSAAVQQRFLSAFEYPAEQAAQLRAWVLFFVALHDIGKLHAIFQLKSPVTVKVAWPQLLEHGNILRAGTANYDHGLEGYRLLKLELPGLDRSGRSALRKSWGLWRPWIAAAAGHHGALPLIEEESPPMQEYGRDAITAQDKAARQDWLICCETLFLAPAGLSLQSRPPEGREDVNEFFAGYCSLCDWIGSNAELFPYTAPNLTEADYFEARIERIGKLDLLRQVGLIERVRPCVGIDALLGDDERPRGVQTIIDKLPAEPGLVLIEAPTGSGKTEAALAHAWKLMDHEQADGIIFALPTQATANAMLTRLAAFASKAYDNANIVLAHGNRDLNREFGELIARGNAPTVQGQQEAGAQCAGWLASSRKRVFLGQIGVCTVDQVLLTVLPVRHGFVRGFGVGRSVLIVDEVHAYDAYMNGLLIEILERQKALGGSAILLSATLPSLLRSELLNAWAAADIPSPPYPAIWSTVGADTKLKGVSAEQAPAARSVLIELAKRPDAFPDASIVQRIIAAATDGALVAIIANTVDAAQRLYRDIAAHAEVPVDLFHARYRLVDRQAIEHAVIRRYGRQAERGAGRILVATQVIEQSLDLDFDWMMTQLCPVDLLFQRLGRLHRFDLPLPRQGGFHDPSCIVLAPEGIDYGVHGLIYADALLLWRTEHLLAERRRIDFPDAYRQWIERAYADHGWENEPEELIGEHLACRGYDRNARAKAQQRANTSYQAFQDTDEIMSGLTRDGEMSLTVLPILQDGRLLDGHVLDELDEHAITEALMLNSIPVPHGWDKWLKGCDRDSEGRYRLSMSAVAADGFASADGRFRYTSSMGLERLTPADDPDLPA
jgi:CRISPR-associated endonuclease/helicase Cas3